MGTDFLKELLESKSENYLDFKNLSWEQELELCGKPYPGMSSTATGGLKRNRHYRCHHHEQGPNGEPACPDCKRIYEWRKSKRVEESITDAFDNNSVLYLTRTSDAAETKRLIDRVRRKGGRYLSIPCNADGGKVFLLDRFDKITRSIQTTKDDALNSFMPFRDKSDWGYFSGNLNKSEQSADDLVEYTIPDKLNVTIDEDLWLGIETEATLSIGIDEITESNAGEAVRRRLYLMRDIASECGFKNVKYTSEKEVKISLSELKDSWMSAGIRLVSKSDIKRYPPAVSWKLWQVAEAGIDDLKAKNRSYLSDHPEAIKSKAPVDHDDLSSLGIYGDY